MIKAERQIELAEISTAKIWPLDFSMLETYPPELMPSENELKNIQYPWELWDLLQRTLRERIQDVRIGSNITSKDGLDYALTGPVWIGDNVRVLSGAQIVGPCFIGDNVLIGNNSIVRASYVGMDGEIGIGNEVVRSIIGNRTMLHRAYAGDSIFGDDVHMGGQAQTANYNNGYPIKTGNGKKRISTGLTKLGAMVGSNTFIGADVQIQPGVRIGSGSFIGVGAVIQQDLPDNVYVKVIQELDIRPNRNV